MTDQDEINEAVSEAKEKLRQEFRLDEIERRLGIIEGCMKKVGLQIDILSKVPMYWRMGIVLLIGFGGFVAWLVSVSGNILKMFK